MDKTIRPGPWTRRQLLAVAPVVLLYLAAQRYFVEGITLTGMGGR